MSGQHRHRGGRRIATLQQQVDDGRVDLPTTCRRQMIRRELADLFVREGVVRGFALGLRQQTASPPPGSPWIHAQKIDRPSVRTTGFREAGATGCIHFGAPSRSHSPSMAVCSPLAVCSYHAMMRASPRRSTLASYEASGVSVRRRSGPEGRPSTSSDRR
jgi:hypothetical protein